MTADPLRGLENDSLHLLTIKEYAELGETEHGYTELIEGRTLSSRAQSQTTEEFGYVDDQTATGTFRTEVPFPFEVKLDRLV